MPIANRCIEPVYVSQVKVPEHVENELEYVVNATLSNFIQQIACLTIKAKDIFDELTVVLTNIVDRSIILENKIDLISEQVRSNQSVIIPPLVNKQIDIYKTCNNQDDELLNHTEMPECIREIFDKAEAPPELQKFDEFRKDDTESLKYYTDPGFFLREWFKNVRVEKIKKKEKRKRRSTKLQKENPPLLPPPAINNPIVQEIANQECPVNYNYGDVAIYEDPSSFKVTDDQNNTIGNENTRFTVPNNYGEISAPIPPPLPPPLLPPPAIIADVPNTILPPPADLKVNSIQNLLKDIQKGALLKPVTVKAEEKTKIKDFRAMIAELRPAWENNSESEESEED